MPDKDEQDTTRKSALAYGAVFSIIVSILTFLLIGWLLDKWLKTDPWLVVTGIILGTAVGFFQLIRVLSRLS
jgi:F0F1-type ATP synthase assembly protein I